MCHHLINVFSKDASLFSSVNRFECVCVPPLLACLPEVAGAERGVRERREAVYVVALQVLLQGVREGNLSLHSPSCVSFPGAARLGVRPCAVVGSQGLASSSRLRRLLVLWGRSSLPGDQGRMWSPTGRQSPALRFLSHVSTRKQKGTQRGPRRRTMNYSSPGPGWGCSQRLLFPS